MGGAGVGGGGGRWLAKLASPLFKNGLNEEEEEEEGEYEALLTLFSSLPLSLEPFSLARKQPTVHWKRQEPEVCECYSTNWYIDGLMNILCILN